MKKLLLTLIFAFSALIGFAQAVDTLSYRDYILGDMMPKEFVVLLGFAYVGVVVNSLIVIFKRNTKSRRSPVKFSSGFWWKDNWKRILGSLLLIPVVILIGEEGMGLDIGNFTAFCIGGGIDAVIDIIRKRFALLADAAAGNQPPAGV